MTKQTNNKPYATQPALTESVPYFKHSDKYDSFVSSTIPDSHVPPAIDHSTGLERPVQDEFHPIKSFKYSNPELVEQGFDNYEFTADWKPKFNFTQFTPPNPLYTTRTHREATQARGHVVKPYSVDWSLASANSKYSPGIGPLDYGISFTDSWFQSAAARIDSEFDPSQLTTSPKASAIYTMAESRLPVGFYASSFGNRTPDSIDYDKPIAPTRAHHSRGIPEIPNTPTNNSKPSLLTIDRAVEATTHAPPEARNRYTVGAGSAPVDLASPATPVLHMPACTSCGHREPCDHALLVMDRVWAALDDFLTPEEIASLPGLIDSRGITPAKISTAVEGFVNPQIRVTDVGWIQGTEASAWLYRRLWEAVAIANNNMFHYDIQHLEPLQYSIYAEDRGGHYTPHYDWGAGDAGMRKLSFTIQLSDPSEYEGGDLVLYSGEPEPISAPKTRGSITVFPSWMLHAVTPVTWGVRKSLVGWFQGPVHF